MAQRGICEQDAKRLLSEQGLLHMHPSVRVSTPRELEKLSKKEPWLKDRKLVVKIDQLIGKRHDYGLIGLDLDFNGAVEFIRKHSGQEIEVGNSKGPVTHFLVEPMVKHGVEYYLAIKTARDYDTIYFSEQGGTGVEERWKHTREARVPVLEDLKDANLKSLVGHIPVGYQEGLIDYIKKLYEFFKTHGFAYFEINPLTFREDNHIPVALDVVAKLDDTSAFESGKLWGSLEFPAPFGLTLGKEEAFIKSIDEKSGSSLKLTILNPEGRVWTMVAGGGSSVIYADTIADLGFAKDLANYGEYSGNPTTQETYQYATTLLDLMTRKKNAKGKILLIGGGIANFTDVAKTFTGIIKALREYAPKIREHKIKIYVRRGGPNYEEGLANIKKLGEELKLPLEVYGPEAHMTSIARLALKKK